VHRKDANDNEARREERFAAQLREVQDQHEAAWQEHEEELKQRHEADLARRLQEEQNRQEELRRQGDLAAAEARRAFEAGLKISFNEELASRLREVKEQADSAWRQREEELNHRHESDLSLRAQEEPARQVETRQQAQIAAADARRAVEEEWERRFDEELAVRLADVQEKAEAARQRLQQEMQERLQAEVHRLEEQHLAADETGNRSNRSECPPGASVTPNSVHGGTAVRTKSEPMELNADTACGRVDRLKISERARRVARRSRDPESHRAERQRWEEEAQARITVSPCGSRGNPPPVEVQAQTERDSIPSRPVVRRTKKPARY
jgi:hypothetical protein